MPDEFVKQKRKILVIRLSSLGDLVLSTAALKPLSEAGFEVFVCTKAAFASLLEGQALVSGVFPYKKDGGESEARKAFFAWVEEQRFDAILDLHDSLRTRFWRLRLRRLAPVFVARKQRLREWLVLFLRLRKLAGFGAGGRARLFRSAALKVLGHFQLPSAKEPLLLTRLDADATLFAELKERLPKAPYAVLLPGSAWEGKRWDGFPELAARLSAEQSVLVLGGREDAERAAAIRVVNPGRVVSLAGELSFKESLAAISGASLVIGNDTGMVHAAEALGVPAVMVEGPTHPSMGFSLHGKKSRIVSLDLFCRPCSKTGRICWRFGSRACLKIPAASVLDGARELR